MFEWDNEIEIEVRRNGENGPVVEREKTTPKTVVSNPYNHRPEDILNSVCAVLKEIINIYEIQGRAAQKSLDAIKSSQVPVEVPTEGKLKAKFEFKRNG